LSLLPAASVCPMGGIPLKLEEVDCKVDLAMKHLSLPSSLVSQIEMHDFDSDDQLRERSTGWEEDNVEVIVSGSANVQAVRVSEPLKAEDPRLDDG
jgi:hypothetical protein